MSRRIIVIALVALGVSGTGTASAQHRHHAHRVVHHAKPLPDPVAYMRAIAVSYWGAQPCGGNYVVHFTDLGPSPETDETGMMLFGWADPASCTMTLSVTLWPSPPAFDSRSLPDNGWGLFCHTFLHEYGHLIGRQHSTDPTSIMYPDLTAAPDPPICKARLR